MCFCLPDDLRCGPALWRRGDYPCDFRAQRSGGIGDDQPLLEGWCCSHYRGDPPGAVPLPKVRNGKARHRLWACDAGLVFGPWCDGDFSNFPASRGVDGLESDLRHQIPSRQRLCRVASHRCCRSGGNRVRSPLCGFRALW